MHPNAKFDWKDRSEMLALIQEVSFCTVFVATAAGNFAIHVPVLVGGETFLRFHVAKANRAASALAEARALLSCVGPNAYISPDWYGTPDQVPTWNYLAVEAEGRLRTMDLPELVQHLDALSALQEARLAPKKHWTRAKMRPGLFERMTAGILGFEMKIEALRGTRKLAQHKTAAEVDGAVRGLAASGGAEMAKLMRLEAPL
ncbi:MAG: FMN-binding negative transcriptional regulator [Pseudomonadota bacterium]|nr:FMN-binding negative transcriptional regulator [Pseudomonadota bacterium]